MTAPAAVENAYIAFRVRYANNVTRMVREVWGADPHPDQLELLAAYERRERRITKRSGHGVGKTTSLAWVIIHHALCRYPQKTVCTAPTTAQLFDALAVEVKSWIEKLPEGLRDLFEVKSERIELRSAPNDSFISFRTSRPETPEAMAGVHSEWVLLIADEASGIPHQVFEAAVGSMSGQNAITILAGNPVRSSGYFYDSHNKPGMMEEWVRLKVSCIGHPQVDPDLVRQVATTYGERSNAYRVRILGEFPLADDNTIIPFEIVDPALKRDVKPTMVRPIWGVDVGRFGSDASALAKRKGNTLLEPVRTFQSLDTMQFAGRIKQEYDACAVDERPSEINVDVIGIGAGVCDRLREMGLPARGINVSESPALGDMYRNLRTELWFKGKDWFSQRDCNLCGDEELAKELISQTYEYTVGDKLWATPKAKMKKMGIESPNRADAFLLTLASDAISALSGSAGSTSWNQPLKWEIRGLV